MHIYNLKKVKNQINVELHNRIEEQRNIYLYKLKEHRENQSDKEVLFEGNESITYEKIENKNIRKEEYKIISNTKLIYNEFTNCKFTQIIFKDCLFYGSFFNNCSFLNVIFENCSFINEKSIIVFEQKCIFKDVTFINSNLKKSIFKKIIFEDIKFIKCNLRDSIFSNAQIKSIQISDSDCRSYKILDSSIDIFEIEDEYITKFDEYTFVDKIIVDNKHEKSYEYVAKAYRVISTKFENNNLLDHAGEYYYLSKKAESKTLKGIDKIKSHIFWMLCGYGERPSYALITSVELVILFAILYMFTGLRVDGVEINYSKTLFQGSFFIPSLYRDFFYSLYFSITTFTTVGYGDITPVKLSILLSGIEMFLGVTMVGLWTAILARKIIR